MSLAGIIEEVLIVLNDLHLEPDSFHLTLRLKQPAVFSTFGQSAEFPPNYSSVPMQQPSPRTQCLSIDSL